MKNVANTVEDLLEVLAGLQGESKIQIESSDATIMYSIARQSFKGTALTDRQYSVVKEKLQTYREKFTALDYDFDRAVDVLRQPLRQIDRSKYIKLVDTLEVYGKNEVYESYKSDWAWLAIRFPFAKKTIINLDKVKCKVPNDEVYHKKGTHIHYFKLTEKNMFELVSEFVNSNFEIDSKILECYNVLKEMKEQPWKYTRSISKNLELVNFPDNIKNLAIEEIGSVSQKNIHLYMDRAEKYGINHIDSELLQHFHTNSTLVQKIVKRNKKDVFISNTEYRFEELVAALNELERFPILIILPENQAEDILRKSYETFKNIIPSSEITVMFRFDNDTGKSFNTFIQEKGIGSPLDKSKKIVYISSNKVPKPLIESKMNFKCAIQYSEVRPNINVKLFFQQQELSIHYSEELSLMSRYGNITNGVEIL